MVGKQAGLGDGADPQGYGHTGRDMVGLSFQRGCRGAAGVEVSYEAVPNSCG